MITPSSSLPRRTVPLTSVPIRLPSTRFADGAPSRPKMMATPLVPLPEMTLAAPAAMPPIVLSDPSSIRTPARELPRSTVPLTSVPMKLPET